MRRVAIKIAYMGAGFCGSQYQPGLRTVVGDVISDLIMVHPKRDMEWFDIKPSSRTDAGVNALDNVIAINTDFDDNIVLLRALNSVSKSIFYRGITDVSVDFNPRFANSRVYRYVLPSDGLDINLAKECARLFIGEHDFIRFCKVYEDKPTVTTMDSIDVIEKVGYLELIFHSQYFLWNMIRKISAAIDSVARGRRTLDDVRRALDGEDIQFGIARPEALTLMEVNYDDLSFTFPEKDAYQERLDEELFMIMTKNTFLSSL